MSAGRAGVSLAVAGTASVATAFGMARYGYGLLLPDIKHSLVLGETELGAIGTLAYLTYIVAAAMVDPCVRRCGPRGTVVIGGLLGVGGTLLIAVCDNSPELAAGVGTAGASAGLVYPPFAEVLRELPERIRDRALASVNCGTGWGVAVAAPIAILAASSWRLAYLGFAACALASTLYAARLLPARGPSDSYAERPRLALRELRPDARRIMVGALLVGLGSGAYWTFAVQHARAAGLDVTAGRVLLGLAGVGSVFGIAAADVIGQIGAKRTFLLCAFAEAVATVLLAAWASRLSVVMISAVVFGVSYNVSVAVSVLAMTRLHRDRPAPAVALVAGANAAGLLFSPLAGGVLGAQIGLTATLLCGAAVLLLASVGAPLSR